MVASWRKSAWCFSVAALVASLLFISCHGDILGLIGSADFEYRQGQRNRLVYLDEKYRRMNLGERYTFVVLSDTHIENSKAQGLERLAGALVESDAFVVINGDVTQSGKREEVKRFLSIAEDIAQQWDIPVFPVLGNHDTYFDNWNVWKNLIGSSVYRIDMDTATLIMLDSANATFGTGQLAWFEDQLKTANGRVFVFTHTNLFVRDVQDFQQLTDVRERARIMSLLPGRCDALFMGHVHQRLEQRIGGVHYITTEDFRSHKTYCRVSVGPEGISWQFHSL